MIDLDAEMQFWVDALALRDVGWTITWGWVDSIPLEDGRNAFGLNTLNADNRVSDIKIRELRTDTDKHEFVDTCAHEVAHCWGAEVERRILEAHALQDAAEKEKQRTAAHEYIATTMAPIMEKIKGTPRELAFAKAIKSLSRKTEAIAKVVDQQQPARAKGLAMPIDPQKLAELAMRAGELKAMEGLPPEAAALLEEMIAVSAGAQAGPDSSLPAVPPPPAGTDNPDGKGPPPAAKPLEEPGYAKAIEVLVDAREDLKPRRADVLGYLKKHHKTVEGAAEYLKTIPLAKVSQEAKAPAAKPLDDKPPQGGKPSGGVQLLAKADERAKVGALMGLPTNAGKGPQIVTRRNGDETYKVFTTGTLTPSQWRAKKAAGWDPSREFPMPGQEGQ